MNKKQIEQEELLLKRLPEYTAVEYLADSFASAICFALKDKRKEIGMSQKEVAKKTGIRQPKICMLERFFHVPTLTTVGKYLYALGYTIEDVYKIASFIKNLKKGKEE